MFYNNIYKKILKNFLKSSHASEKSYNLNSLKLPKLDVGPPSKVSQSKEDGMKMLKQMQIMRMLETIAGNLYNEKYGGGLCYLYTGQIYKKIFKNFLNSSHPSEASFKLNPFKLHNLEVGPASKVKISKKDGLKMLKQMQIIRILETIADNLYNEKYGGGFYHLYSGQEACAVGMWSAMRPEDCAISAYCVHGWTALMGGNVNAVLAELIGRQNGTAGKEGSMYMYARNFYGGNDIVSAQVLLGAGVAFACKYKQAGGVCLTFYGDGASNQGEVLEAFNIAKLWSLPCIFVCQNNSYGMGTNCARSPSNNAYFKRDDYIPSIQVDGLDVLAVREATKFAIEHCATGQGPILLETVSFRNSRHLMANPRTSYRARDKIHAMRHSQDPILIFKNKLLNANLATEADLKNIEIDIKKIVETGVRLARDDEIPVEELTPDVFTKNVDEKVNGIPHYKWQSKNYTVLKNILNI